MESKKNLPFCDFLGSDTIELCTSSSSETWKIHRKLFLSKCKAVESAFTHDFPEARSGKYNFIDTTHDTVARFTEWAYTGDYTEVMHTSIDLSQPKQPKEPQSESTSGENKASQAPTLQAHTLLCHLQVYIFSQTYLVPELKDLAFEKFSAVLEEIERPKGIDEQLAVIDCLSLAFSEVQPYDKLREWLAQYAAWCLHSLRLQPDFHQLLQRCPALSCRMMDILNPAVQAPWDVKWPKYRVPSYGARGFYEEGSPHEEDAVS